jgi:hypothetical protein
MATKIILVLEDDLDGQPADETVRFAIGGTAYEIDLRTKNATALACGQVFLRRTLMPLAAMQSR